ncbi:MAG: lecithin retinol acyltransferase family protein [Pirellula sp.]
MAKGDLVSIPCLWLMIPYRHFGIDIGDGTVVHLATDPAASNRMTVQRVSFTAFADGKPVRIENVSDAFPDDDVVSQALGRVGESGYHLVAGNCEHFARECKCGIRASHQSDRLVQGVCRAGVAGLLAASANAARVATMAGVPKGMASRSSGIATLVAEAARHSAYAASRCAKLEHKKAEVIGRTVGVTTAAVAGLLTAGPRAAASAAVVYLSIDSMANSTMNSISQTSSERSHTKNS